MILNVNWLFQTRKRKPKGMKNSDGTTSKSTKNSASSTVGKSICKIILWRPDSNIYLNIVDYLLNSNGTNQRKNKNTKNLILANLETKNGNSSASSSQSNHNLSPISYSSQVPSPMTTITPTSSKFETIMETNDWHYVISLFLVPSMTSSGLPMMTSITSTGLPLNSASTVITTSSGMMTSNNYPQLTPLTAINNHLYQQSSMMNSDLNQSSPTCFQSSFPHVLDLIKMENGSPHIAHTNLTRELERNNNNKALDLELKQRQTLATLNIESR